MVPECRIKRLGHVVLMVNDFSETFEWYQRRLGLLISDQIVMDKDGQEHTLGPLRAATEVRSMWITIRCFS